MDIANLSPQNLRKAADLKERIDELQGQVNAILGGQGSTPDAGGKKRKMTAAWRKALSLGQKARWAAKRGKAATKTARATVSQGKPNRYTSPALRKARSDAMKARWAKARRAGKPRP